MSPVAAADLIAYQALNGGAGPGTEVEDDTAGTVGGAIDPDIRIIFVDLASDDDLQASLGDVADETLYLKIKARNSSGVLLSETKILTGGSTTPVEFDTLGVVHSIQSARLYTDAGATTPATSTGTVDVETQPGATLVAQIPAGESGFTRLFKESASEASPVDRFEKIFLKNDHGSLALLAAIITENADPSSKVTFCVEDAVDDSNTTTAGRKNAPTAATMGNANSYVNTNIALLGALDNITKGEIGWGEAIGVWLQQSLLADDGALEEPYTVDLDGSTVA